MNTGQTVYIGTVASLGGASVIIGVEQIQSILGMVLVGVQILLVVIGLVFKLIKAIKQKNAEQAVILVEEAEDKIKDIDEQIQKLRIKRARLKNGQER